MNKKQLAASVKRGRRKQRKAFDLQVAAFAERFDALVDALPLDDDYPMEETLDPVRAAGREAGTPPRVP